MTDFNKILEKAKEVEAKMKESQEKIKQIELIFLLNIMNLTLRDFFQKYEKN